MSEFLGWPYRHNTMFTATARLGIEWRMLCEELRGTLPGRFVVWSVDRLNALAVKL